MLTNRDYHIRDSLVINLINKVFKLYEGSSAKSVYF